MHSVFRRLLFGGILGFFLFTLFAWNPRVASAIPAFARKYDMDCSHCHTAVPQLTEFGMRFLDNGFQMKGLEENLEKELRDRVRKEDPEDIHPAYWPLSFRTQGGYRYLSKTNQDTTVGNRHVVTGTAAVNGLWLMTGGILTPGVSFFASLTPFLENVDFTDSGQEGELHLGWIRYTHPFTAGVTNLKFGLISLDMVVLPLDHQRITVAPYEILEYTPGEAVSGHGSTLGGHKVALELLGRYSNGFRYALTAMGGGSPHGGSDNNRVLDLYTRVSQTVAGQSLGFFGYWGQDPTGSLECTTCAASAHGGGGGSGPISGTGLDNATYYRYGGDLNLHRGALNLVGLYLYGYDAQDLFNFSSQGHAARFHGGFLEANFHVKSADIMVVGRYDMIRNIQQGYFAYAKTEQDTDRMTVAFRGNTLLTNRVGLLPHLEFSHKKQKRAGISDLDVVENSVLAGVDFSF